MNRIHFRISHILTIYVRPAAKVRHSCCSLTEASPFSNTLPNLPLSETVSIYKADGLDTAALLAELRRISRAWHYCKPRLVTSRSIAVCRSSRPSGSGTPCMNFAQRLHLFLTNSWPAKEYGSAPMHSHWLFEHRGLRLLQMGLPERQ